MKEVKFKDLKKEYQEILQEAEKVLENSYSPYSNFKVGAALLSVNGKIITGTNVENASYGVTICAERAALAKANSEGERCFKALALIAKGDFKDDQEIVTPCGICRQSLLEFSQFCGEDLEVIMSNNSKTKIIIAQISELLPLSFKANKEDKK